MTRTFHSDVKVQKHKKKIFKKIGFFLIFILSICLVILLAEVFSTALTAGKFNFATVSKNTIKIEQNTLYAITMGKSEDKFKALNIASSATVMGAGGYVWKEENTYYVVANIYNTYDDAKKVLENLVDTNFVFEIFEIDLNKIELNASTLSKEEKVLIKDSLNYLYSLYANLYNLANDVDTKVVTFVQASGTSNSFKSECVIRKTKLQTLYLNSKLNYVTKLFECYVYVCEVIDTLTFNLLKNSQTQLNYFVKMLKLK